jgi:hypothetical protein
MLGQGGEIYTVRYEAVNAMLLNELLNEQERGTTNDHHAVEVYRCKARGNYRAAAKQIETLTVGLQKGSAQLEASKPAPQTVLNRQ